MDIVGRLIKGFDDKEHAIVLDLGSLSLPKGGGVALFGSTDLIPKIRSGFFRIYGLDLEGKNKPSSPLYEAFNGFALLDPASVVRQPLREAFMEATRRFNRIYPWQDFRFFTRSNLPAAAALDVGWKTRTLAPNEGAQAVLDTLKIGS